jgi:hypothetical protein
MIKNISIQEADKKLTQIKEKLALLNPQTNNHATQLANL